MSVLRDIARTPRASGTAACAAARARCALELEALGFRVQERTFQYSAFVGRYATPLFGAAGAILVGTAGQAAALTSPTPALPAVILLLGAVALWTSARWLTRVGVLAVPLLRARGVNLVATRGNGTPDLWLCAHVDAKSQPVPTLVRSLGVLVEGTGYVIAVLVAAADVVSRTPHPASWTFAAVVTLLGAVPVMLSTVSNHSPGALDNASGIATVLAAARRVGDSTDVGVLITDAEELGLAGARAWAASGAPSAGTTLLNCDGVDDNGLIGVTFAGRRPDRLLDAVGRAAIDTGISCEVMRLVPGILTDAVAFSDSGMASVTFSRGSLRSLLRVHTRRDDLAHLHGTGVAETADLMANTVLHLHGIRTV